MTKLEQIAYDFLKPRLGDSINGILFRIILWKILIHFAFLEQISPAQIQEFYLDTNKETIDKNFIILTFYPSKDGIPVISHPYYVTVDMDTGTITNYKGSSFDPASLPAKSNILSIKEATQAYIQSYPFQLAYILSPKNGIPRLVYTVLPDDTEAKTIDAKTGQLLTMENK
ncbi:hypothetical protein [Brevibacillus laterosporus]|uniref:hypothetical protein n=1 Tax=Brevibacillus laterosporus TaxID=1465 RepID=UPI000EB13CFD|nr:hypothetical protein [Brevibacillus laterosporus]AYK05459.1 hypothetical protein D8Z77_03015 [Brevibacillus laterosporus]